MKRADTLHAGTDSIRQRLRRITIAGCLFTLFAAITGSPIATAFYLEIGATDRDLGLMGGLITATLGMQSLGGMLVNHLGNRKTPCIILASLARFLYLPIAFIPLVFTGLSSSATMGWIIAMLTVSNAMIQLVVPIWVSWMSDVVPSMIMNRYWGARASINQACGVAFTLALAAFMLLSEHMHWSVLAVYPLLMILATIGGVGDMLMYTQVPEPACAKPGNRSLLSTFAQPFRDPEYRRYIVFACVWSGLMIFSGMLAQAYAYKSLKMEKSIATLVWLLPAIGMAMTGKAWGSICDRFGHRPVLILCTYARMLPILILLLAGPTVQWYWIIGFSFLFDGIWGAAQGVASNGYLMKVTPRENRTMYVAAMSGLAGIAGGIGAYAAGQLSDRITAFSWHFAGHDWNNYHVVFAVGLVLRIITLPLGYRIHEPRSAAPGQILPTLVEMWPLNWLLMPIRLYRRSFPNNHTHS